MRRGVSARLCISLEQLGSVVCVEARTEVVMTSPKETSPLVPTALFRLSLPSSLFISNISTHFDAAGDSRCQPGPLKTDVDHREQVREGGRHGEHASPFEGGRQGEHESPPKGGRHREHEIPVQ